MSWLGLLQCSRLAQHDLNRLGLPWLSCPRIPAAQCAELAALWWAADGPGLGRLRELPRPADRHLRLAQRLPECRRVRSTRLVPQGVMTEVVPRVENREKHSTKPSLRTHTTRERPFTVSSSRHPRPASSIATFRLPVRSFPYPVQLSVGAYNRRCVQLSVGARRLDGAPSPTD